MGEGAAQKDWKAHVPFTLDYEEGVPEASGSHHRIAGWNDRDTTPATNTNSTLLPEPVVILFLSADKINSKHIR